MRGQKSTDTSCVENDFTYIAASGKSSEVRLVLPERSLNCTGMPLMSDPSNGMLIRKLSLNSGFFCLAYNCLIGIGSAVSRATHVLIRLYITLSYSYCYIYIYIYDIKSATTVDES